MVSKLLLLYAYHAVLTIKITLSLIKITAVLPQTCAALLVGRSLDRFPVVSLGDFFFRGTPDRTMCPEVDSASESEYQGFLLG